MDIYSSFKHRKNKIIQYFDPGCLILCYHRVGNDVNDMWGNSVSVENFNNHMKFIAINYQTLSMDEIKNIFLGGKIPFRRSIVVTFDDGYAINLDYACDILNEYKIPATFYMNTYTLGTDELFWWDDLQLIFSNKNNLPDDITLIINGIEVKLILKDPIKFNHSYFLIHKILKGLNEKKRLSLINILNEQIKHDYNIPIELQPISKEGINQIANHSLFTVGGHSHSHVTLGLITENDQEVEIKKNKEILEKITGSVIKHFSYPFGGPDDYNNETIKILKGVGYDTAVTTIKNIYRLDDNLFSIPRFSIKNWDISIFKNKIDNYWYY